MLSANPRYALLNEQIFAARGEDLHLAIDGVERLSAYADTIAPEAACTSVQLHQLVDPGAFARHWNAAQCIAGIQLAVGANSPFFFGRELWRETRIALFEQATDTRSEELKAQGVRPRVWFGERWITSIFDLFEENVRYFPSLLPVVEEEDPVEVLERGDTPRLQELRLHNGTIYRWNRPIYDVVRGRPHLRVENRVLPAGPTVVDTLANAAFYYGLVRVLADEDRPLWTQMSFSAAEENFHACARDGIDARVYWPGLGEVPAAELVLRGCCRWRTRGSSAGASTPPTATACSASSSAAASRDATARRGRPTRSTASTSTRPRRRAARDDRALPRAHALQRAGPHLARRLTSPHRACCCSSRPLRARRALPAASPRARLHAQVHQRHLRSAFKDRRRRHAYGSACATSPPLRNRTTGKRHWHQAPRRHRPVGKHIVAGTSTATGRALDLQVVSRGLVVLLAVLAGCGGEISRRRRPEGRDRRRGARGAVGDRVPARRPGARHRAARPDPHARRRRRSADPVAEVDVSEQGEGGLLGLALDPEFADNGLVYLYFTTPTAMKLERWRFADDRLRREADLIDGTIQAGTVHDSGRIAFGPDGDLYVATGEAGQPRARAGPELAQRQVPAADAGAVPRRPERAGDRLARPPQPAGLRLAAGHRSPDLDRARPERR